MPSSGPIDILAAGLGHLRRHPYLSLGIVLLGTLLSALGTLVQFKLHLPDDLTTQFALSFVAMVPLLIYFVPRFLAQLDAESLNHPENSMEHWKAHFEERWLTTFGVRMLLYLVAGLGATLFFFPGLIVLALFGWAPLRVLLRGDTLAVAARTSLALMTRTWPLVVRTVLLLLGAYLFVFLCVLTGIGFLLQEPTPWQRMTHPAIWGGRLIVGALDLALSACLLALYQTIEPALDQPREDAQPQG